MKRFLSFGLHLLTLLVVCSLLSRGTISSAEDEFDKAKKDLKKALAAKDAKALAEMVSKLVTMDTDRALDTILDSLNGKVNVNDQDLYWILIRGAATFTSASAADKLGDFVNRYQKSFIVRDILSILKSNRSKELLPMLTKLLEKGDDNIKPLIVEHLQEFPGKDVAGILIDALKRCGNKDGGLKTKIVDVLSSLTGQNFGESADQWADWVEKNKDQDWTKPAAGGGSASGTIVDTLDKSRKSDFERLKAPMGKILVLRSECDHNGQKGSHDFDHIEAILQKLGIAHTVISKKEIETTDLTGVMAILVNCNQWREHCVCPDCHPGDQGKDRLKVCVCSKTPPVHINVSTKFSDAAVKRIQEFVMKGGYLFTEDWELEELVQRAFPGIVKRGDYMTEGEANVVPYAGTAAHPYMKGIFGLKKKMQGGGDASDASGTGVSPQDVFEDVSHNWKIDNESPIIMIENKNAVTPLLFSPSLAKSYQNGGIAAVTFSAGQGKLENIGTGFEQNRDRMKGGRVLHVLSHFGKQKSQVDEYTLQNMLVNFLMEANERQGLGAKK